MRDTKLSKKMCAVLALAIATVLVSGFVYPAFAQGVASAGKASFFQGFKDGFVNSKFYEVLIVDARYKLITEGLLVTLYITFFALLIGLALGFVVAIIRSTHDKIGKLGILNSVCKLYLTIFRGTPIVVQLLIIYFLWLGQYHVPEDIVAIIAFGLNSGAYVAEIFRSGIMSIDNGQFEAGRSLGFSYTKTMIYIIMPQAFKNVLPTLANEFIVLLKETSVASFIAVKDMMKGAKAVAATTYNYTVPYISVALVYLVLVLILQKGVSMLERRLSNSDH